MKNRLGAIPLSEDVLEKSAIGLWAFELDDGKAPRMYVDSNMLTLLGLKKQVSPEETYHAWYDHIDEDSYDLVSEAVSRMSSGHAEVQYPWHHPDGRTMIVRCGGVRNYEYKSGIRIEGTHQDVTEIVHYDEEERHRSAQQKIDLANAELRAEALAYVADHDGSVEEFVEFFGDKILKIVGCDQVIFRYLDGTRTVRNAPGISDISTDICSRCLFSNLNHEVYQETGVVQLDNCQEGFNGVKADPKCPAKSSIMQHIYSDGKLAGLLSFHYLNNYHAFTESQTVLLKTLAQYLGLLLGRINAKKVEEEKKNSENQLFSSSLLGALSETYSALYYVIPETGSYEIFSSDVDYNNNVVAKMKNGNDFYGDASYNIDAIVYPDDREKVSDFFRRENMKKGLEKSNVYILEFREYDGNDVIWIRDKVVKITDKKGNERYVIGVYNCTEEKIKEQIAERDMAVIAGLSDDFGCVVYVDLKDNSEIHYRFDPLFEKNIPGWSSITNFSERLRRLIDTVMHPDDREEFYNKTRKDVIISALRNDTAYYVNFRTLINGEVTYYQAKFVSNPTDDNYIVTGFHNVDVETKREIEALNKAEKASRAKTDFLFNMSHDIRTPMNAIIGFTNMAVRDIADTDKALSSLKKSIDASEMLLSIINDILDMSRIESGKVSINTVKADMTSTFVGIEPMMSELAKAKNINITFEQYDITSKLIYVDIPRTERILVNIISNAIKYTREGGRVKVSVRQMDKEKDINGRMMYRYEVEDTGIGMSEEFMKRCFEEFAREENSTTSGIQGTGLGLPLAKALTELMGGRIYCKSKQGVGTTFTIDLPFEVDETERVDKTEYRKEEAKVSFSGLNILLVEDNELNREIAVDMLTEAGMLVTEAVDGRDAISKVRQHDPGYFRAILMDIQMPFMNGYEAARAIRDLCPNYHIPIIALSANAFEEDKQKSVAAGMDDHVAKPIKMGDLRKVLSKYL